VARGVTLHSTPQFASLARSAQSSGHLQQVRGYLTVARCRKRRKAGALAWQLIATVAHLVSHLSRFAWTIWQPGLRLRLDIARRGTGGGKLPM
jgi:hypothetical protein